MFTNSKDEYGIYGAYVGKRLTCTVCGSTWVNGPNNDCWGHMSHCNNVVQIEEWDGTKEWVHYTRLGETIKITYQDETTHLVDDSYFESIRR